MMFEVVNRTEFLDALVPGIDKDDVAHVTVLLKGTFVIPARGGPLTWAPEQVPIRHADQPSGPEPTGGVLYESDICPAKVGTDVVVGGHAYAGARKKESIEAMLEVGRRLRKSVRVSGDRVWTRAASAWIISRPVPFQRLPLEYARAFGGIDRGDPDPARHAADQRNPAGTGFVVAGSRERLEGLRLPNLEDPGAAVTAWNSRPPVAGFGVVSRAWLPRRLFAGTYDAAWIRERAPLLPADFDPRFFNGAPTDQVVTPHLRGGEAVRLTNLSPDSLLAFDLPRVTFRVELQIEATTEVLTPKLDTVMIEPDLNRVILCWRESFRCGRRMRQVRRVIVSHDQSAGDGSAGGGPAG